MFRRLLWQLLRGNRGRLAVALVAITGGAAVISALLNMEIDVRQKLTQEFRSLGANMVLSRSGEGDRSLLSGAEMEAAVEAGAPKGAAFAPYLFIVARTAANRPVVLAGTWLDQAPVLTPWWQIQGQSVGSRSDLAHCLVGRNV